jgi:hypothetical protein
MQLYGISFMHPYSSLVDGRVSSNVKVANGQQAEQMYQYKNIKEKLYKIIQLYGIIKLTTNTKLYASHQTHPEIGRLLIWMHERK